MSLKTIEKDMNAVRDLESRLRKAIRDIPDFPKPGILFKDITPILQDATLFASVIDAFADACRGQQISHVVGIEARGFVFASALAYRMGAGLIPARKKGKLPYSAISESYKLEYGEATLEMHSDALSGADSVVLVDDLLATGGTAAATARLIERAGAKLCKILFVVNLTFLNGRQALKGRDIFSLISY